MLLHGSRLLAAAAVLAVFFAPSLAAYAQRDGAAPRPRDAREERMRKVLDALQREHPAPIGREVDALDALVEVAQAEGWQMLYTGRYAVRDELTARYPWVATALADAETDYVFAFEASDSGYRVDAVPRSYERFRRGYSFVASEEQYVRGADHAGAKAATNDPVVATLVDGGARVTTIDYWRRVLAPEAERVHDWVEAAEQSYQQRTGTNGTLEQLAAAGLLPPAFVQDGDYRVTIADPQPYSHGYSAEPRRAPVGRPPASPTELPSDSSALEQDAWDAGPPPPGPAARSADDESALAVEELSKLAGMERVGPKIGGYLSLREIANLLDLAFGASRPDSGFGRGAVPEKDRAVLADGETYRRRFEIAADRSSYRIWMTPTKYGVTSRLSLFVENDGPIRGGDLGGAEAGPSTPPLADAQAWIERAEALEDAKSLATIVAKERAEADLRRGLGLVGATFAASAPEPVAAAKAPAYTRLDLTLGVRVRTAATYDFTLEAESGGSRLFGKKYSVALAPGDDHVTISFDTSDDNGRDRWTLGAGVTTFKVAVTRRGKSRELLGDDDYDYDTFGHVTERSFDVDGVVLSEN